MIELKQAKIYAQMLIDGTNPLTLEPLAEGDICRNPVIVKVLETVIGKGGDTKTRLTSEERQQANIEAGRPHNNGARWSEQDRQALKDGYGSGKGVKALAGELGRSAYSVIACLKNMEVIDDETAFCLKYGLDASVVEKVRRYKEEESA